MKKLIIVGSGGLGRETAWLVERINQVNNTWEILGFLDDFKSTSESVMGYPILGDITCVTSIKNAYLICAIGSSNDRINVVNRILSLNNQINFATLIDPNAIVGKSNAIGEGSIIAANSSLTINVRVGNHVVINPGCTIGHDVIMEDFVSIFPSVSVSGNVTLEKTAQVGVGARILQNLTVEKNAFVGAGAIVTTSVESCTTVVGIPAKKLKK